METGNKKLKVAVGNKFADNSPIEVIQKVWSIVIIELVEILATLYMQFRHNQKLKFLTCSTTEKITY